MRCSVSRPTAASVTLLVAAGLAAGGCGSNSSPGCSSKPAAGAAAAGWTLPGADLQNTRDVASPITSSDVSQLGVAWCVPIEATTSSGTTDGYSTTPVVVHGVVYTQDMW